MDRKYIDDNHVVARYLADQLSDEERSAFEAYYLEHPDVVQEMEAAARLKAGLDHLQRSGELALLMQPKPWYRQQRAYTVAATVAILVMGALLWFSNRDARQAVLAATDGAWVDTLGQPLPVLGTHTILRKRAVSYDAEIELPSQRATLRLLVLPEFEATPSRYRMTLSSIDDDESLREIASVHGLAVDENGFVAAYLDSSGIARGRYRLLVSGDDGTDAADRSSTFIISFDDRT